MFNYHPALAGKNKGNEITLLQLINTNKQWFLFLVFLVLSSTALSQIKNNNRKPNIIYIYADDLGYGEIGAYGQRKISTPHLDQMAKEGIKFTQHYSSSPVCAPARASLLTGKHTGHVYIRGNYELGGYTDDLEGGQMPLPEGTFTLPKMLKQAGYVTAMTGKWGLGMNNTTGSPLKQGFDYYYGYLDQKQAHNFYPTHLWENDIKVSLDNPEIFVYKQVDSTKATDKDFDYYKGNEYAADLMTKKAVDFISKNKNESFFLYMPYTIPHASLQAPEQYIHKYKGQFDEKPYYGQRGYASTRYPLSTYAAMITFLDDQVGIIMDHIKKLGLDDNTIIMFSSDNGTTFNAGVNHEFFNSVDGLRGLKMDVYEGGIRVPFIVRWPGKIKEGSVSDLISVQYDIMATLGEIAGVDPRNTDGISLLPALLQKPGLQSQRDYIYFEYPEKGGQIAVRMGDYKGVRINVKKNPESPWQIFNLRNDRNETTDIAPGNPDLVKKFSETVQKEHQQSHIREWEFINPKFGLNK